MALTSPSNRRLAAFVSLLYVFFSTFGALTHTHALSETNKNTLTNRSSHRTCFTLGTQGSAPAHCPVCDWQSVQVTPAPATFHLPQPALMRFEQTVSAFRLPSLPALRSSSRGPPRV